MKPMGGRTWKYWPASGPVLIQICVTVADMLSLTRILLSNRKYYMHWPFKPVLNETLLDTDRVSQTCRNSAMK